MNPHLSRSLMFVRLVCVCGGSVLCSCNGSALGHTRLCILLCMLVRARTLSSVDMARLRRLLCWSSHRAISNTPSVALDSSPGPPPPLSLPLSCLALVAVVLNVQLQGRMSREHARGGVERAQDPAQLNTGACVLGSLLSPFPPLVSSLRVAYPGMLLMLHSTSPGWYSPRSCAHCVVLCLVFCTLFLAAPPSVPLFPCAISLALHLSVCACVLEIAWSCVH